jgi:hypothetical protein
VHALYNLIEEHRSRLEADYSVSASASKRFRDVLKFMREAENIPATEVMETASCLAELFQLDETHLHGLKASDKDCLPLSMSVLGPVRLIPESKQALTARDQVKRLLPIAMYHFKGERGSARFQNVSLDQSSQQDIGPRDMLYFTCTDSDVSGLASCRIRTVIRSDMYSTRSSCS